MSPTPAAAVACRCRLAGDSRRRRRQVLPIFLDEAAELFPQAGEQLRSWRAQARRRPRRCSAPAAHAAHVQGQRADGRRDAPGRARAPDGKSRLSRRRRGRAGRRRCSTRWTSDLDHIAFVLDASAERRNRYAAAVAARRQPRGTPAAHETPAHSRRRRTPLPVAARTRTAVAPPAHARRSRAPAAGKRSRSRAHAAGARRHDRPAGQRSRRSRDRARPRRGRVALAEGQPARAHQQRDPPALAGARNRDPGRVADPVAHVDGQRGGRGFRSARVRPLHAIPGADARRWPKASTTSRPCSSRC